MDIVKKICPYCKAEFRIGEEVVVCSNCDMPHHKDCWIENMGCTTFGCTGTIKEVDSFTANSVNDIEIDFDEPQASAFSYCTQCGAMINANYSFCNKCGTSLRTGTGAPDYQQYNPVNATPYAYTYQQNYSAPHQYNTGYHQNFNYNQGNSYYQPNFNSYSNAVDPDVQALVESNLMYYIPKFQSMKSRNSKTSWNWVAFLFTPYWFIYRKMYGYGIMAFGVSTISMLINNLLVFLIALCGYIVIGVYANYIYMKWVEYKAAQVKTMFEPLRSDFIRKNGGVNTLALFLSIGIYVVIIGLFNLV